MCAQNSDKKKFIVNQYSVQKKKVPAHFYILRNLRVPNFVDVIGIRVTKKKKKWTR